MAMRPGAASVKPDILEVDERPWCGLNALLGAGQAMASNIRIVNFGFSFGAAPEVDTEQRYRQARQLHIQGDTLGARGLYEAVLRDLPGHGRALHQLGITFLQTGDVAGAQDCFIRSLAADPASAVTYNSLGALFYGQKSYADALSCYDRAIDLEPDFAEAHVNRGNAYKALGDRSQALRDYDRALQLKPGLSAAHANRANALHELGRFPEALAAYDRALALDPKDAEAYFGRASTLLLLGDYAAGLEAYEWRTRLPSGATRMARPELPALTPEIQLLGKRVLVHWEQGLGDTIQFCRYLRLLSDLGARVFFSPQPSLRALMTRLDGFVTLVDDGDPSASYDVRLGLLSSMRWHGSRLESIPRAVAYLRADPQRLLRWQRQLGTSGYRIAVCWQGDNAALGRSFDITDLRPLARLPGVRLISLQKGVTRDQLDAVPGRLAIEHPGEDFDAGPDAFLDAAAVIAACDLVVTCDTAIAHLAGALGARTFLALKAVPDWRWQLGHSDTPWYPSMRLFRQPRRGDWAAVMADMAGALAPLLPASPA